MMLRVVALASLSLGMGCATIKQSDTARTGVEQLLVSSAIDRSLDRVDFRPISGAAVFVEQKYLDCVDKNYVVVALNQRLLKNGCTLVDKQEDAQVVLQVGSGGVGTDRQEMFVGVPEISLPVPVPVNIPKISLYSRTRSNGTAKLTLVAYDAKSKQPVLNNGAMLARSDHKAWNILGSGHVVSGSVPLELERATGESESVVAVPTLTAGKPATVR
ncbi:MAG: hypothetical protein JNL96_11790 [Planctomycetaceae bacterium]|nr:hypothetical protein [Planctomycetaceae bacterium]